MIAKQDPRTSVGTGSCSLVAAMRNARSKHWHGTQSSAIEHLCEMMGTH